VEECAYGSPDTEFYLFYEYNGAIGANDLLHTPNLSRNTSELGGPYDV